MKNERRSAKETVHDLANEIMARPPSPDNDQKLAVLETIASRMSWMDLFNKIRYRERQRRDWTQVYDR